MPPEHRTRIINFIPQCATEVCLLHCAKLPEAHVISKIMCDVLLLKNYELVNTDRKIYLLLCTEVKKNVNWCELWCSLTESLGWL